MLKLAFAGTPDFAAAALAALLDAGHPVSRVLTQPDRPAGRGMQPQPSAVKRLALARGLALEQPASLKDPGVQAGLKALAPDLLVVAAYGLILPQAVLDIPRLGCLNIHASLLPRWRGAAPIQRALLAGDAETGITIMQMDAGLDTGAILLQQPLAIAPGETSGTLHARLAALGAQAICEALALLATRKLAARPQDPALATYAAKVQKQEAAIDWSQPAQALERALRAFDPQPGAHCELDGVPLKLWRGSVLPLEGRPGEVLAAGREGIVVACGTGALRIELLQRPGGRRLAAAQFLAGHPVRPGQRFGTPARDA